jgi:hypothetical protein
MEGQGKVRGILIEGSDGHEYLLGFGPTKLPTFSRRQADGTFERLEDVWRASKTAITQIGHTGGLIGPGIGNYTWLWGPIARPSKRSPRSRRGRPGQDQSETLPGDGPLP